MNLKDRDLQKEIDLLIKEGTIIKREDGTETYYSISDTLRKKIE
jgi:predicted transcriptional regulator